MGFPPASKSNPKFTLNKRFGKIQEISVQRKLPQPAQPVLAPTAAKRELKFVPSEAALASFTAESRKRSRGQQKEGEQPTNGGKDEKQPGGDQRKAKKKKTTDGDNKKDNGNGAASGKKKGNGPVVVTKQQQTANSKPKIIVTVAGASGHGKKGKKQPPQAQQNKHKGLQITIKKSK